MTIISSYLPPAVLLLALAYIVRSVALQFWNQRRTPGPIRWPLFGNTLSVPKPFMWTWYQSLKAQYGSIFHLRILTDDIVVVSDHRIAEELLGRRGTNYASRKYLTFTGKYRSTGRRMLLMPYGPEFIKQRAAMQLLFRPEGVRSNRERQRQQAVKLIHDFFVRPGQWNKHLKSYSSGVALGIAFGMTVAAAHRRMPQMIANTETLGQDLEPGRWLVEYIPFLDCLPDWLAPWRAKANSSHEYEASLFGLWAEEARSPEANALQTESLIAQLWKSQEELKLDNKTIAYIGGSIGEAGTNTTQCVLSCFLYAWTLYPAVMQRAQSELDAVVGDRPPQFTDYDNLPYLFALVKEVLRWVPVTPLALPHLVTHEDQFDGYRIPANSLLVTSIWNMHHDPSIFTNPDVFDPLRFYATTAEGKLPRNVSVHDGIWTFGFGRRACPGRRLGSDSVWLSIAYLLWAYDITGDGSEFEQINRTGDPFAFMKWRDNVNIEPQTLPLKVSARSDERIARIEEEWQKIVSG